MPRSEAQKRADKRYAEKNKGKDSTWSTKIKPFEVEHIDTVLKQCGMNKAQFLRWAVSELERQHPNLEEN